MIHDEPLELWGFRFPDAPVKWVLERDPEWVTLGQLLKKFYEELSYDPNPLAWVRDPQNTEGIPYYGDAVIVLAFRKNFYIVVEKYMSSLYGPHPARLFYKSYQTEETLWVAIMQISEMFYSDDRMKLSLSSGLAAHELYQAPKTAETIVTK